MNQEDFNIILENRIKRIRETLNAKAKEYASGGDRLHNFKVSARVDGESVPESLWGMLKKHLVSVIDLKNGDMKPTDEIIDAKIGDMINYLILLEAVFREEL